MKKRAKTRLTTLVATALIAVACGAPPPPKPPPPPVDADIADLVPAGPDQMARIDVEALRSSSLWQLTEILSGIVDISEIESVAGFDPLALVDEVIVAGTDRPGAADDRMIAVVKGRFDADALVSAVIASGEATSGGVAGKSGALNDEGALIAVTGRTVILGNEEMVRASLELADAIRGELPGPGPDSIEDDPRFGDVSLAPGECVTVMYRRGDSPPDLRRLRRTPLGSWRWMEKVASLDASAEATTHFAVGVTVEMDSEPDARRARRDVSKSVRRLSRNAFVRMLGIAPFLEPLQVSGEGKTASFAYALSAEEIANLAKLADRFRQMKELLSGEEKRDEPVELDPPLMKIAPSDADSPHPDEGRI